jgi:hypothetical protein
MIGKLLCRIGWHNWRLFDGHGFSTNDDGPMFISYKRECRRCGRHENCGTVV